MDDTTTASAPKPENHLTSDDLRGISQHYTANDAERLADWLSSQPGFIANFMLAARG